MDNPIDTLKKEIKELEKIANDRTDLPPEYYDILKKANKLTAKSTRSAISKSVIKVLRMKAKLMSSHPHPQQIEFIYDDNNSDYYIELMETINNEKKLTENTHEADRVNQELSEARNTIKSYEQMILQNKRQIDDCKNQIIANASERQSIERKLQSLESVYNQFEQKKKAEIESLRKQIELSQQQLKVANSQTSSAKIDCSEQIAALRQAHEKKLSGLESDKKQLIDDCEDRAKDAVKQAIEKQGSLSKQEKQQISAEHMRQMQNIDDKYAEQIARLSQESEEMKNHLIAKYDSKESLYIAAQKQKQNELQGLLDTAYDDLQRTTAEMNAAEKEATRKHDELLQQLKGCNSRISGADTTRDALKSQIQDLEEKQAEQQEKIRQSEQTIAQLQSQNDAIQVKEKLKCDKTVESLYKINDDLMKKRGDLEELQRRQEQIRRRYANGNASGDSASGGVGKSAGVLGGVVSGLSSRYRICVCLVIVIILLLLVLVIYDMNRNVPMHCTIAR